MGEKTSIAWCTSSWSPWIGCTKVSPGCDGCYAQVLDNRHQYGGAKHWGPGVPRYKTKQWGAPLTWNKAAAKLGHLQRWTVFPSLCDPFDNEVAGEWRREFFDLVARTEYLTWLLLTKRIGNAMPMLERHFGAAIPANIWLGASVVNQEEFDRDVPKLEKFSGVRFLSYEPALGRIDWFEALGMWWNSTMQCIEGTGRAFKRPVDWVIIGGESSQGTHRARPFLLEWARHTVRACQAAGIPVLVKQLGSTIAVRNDSMEEWPDEDAFCDAIPESYQPAFQGELVDIRLKDRAGADPAEWPADLRVQEFPA